MKVETLSVDRARAAELYDQYITHRDRMTPADAEIAHLYNLIAKGKTVIRAIESIRNAGVNTEGLPKLAIARADASDCWLSFRRDGLRMSSTRFAHDRHRRRFIDIPWPEVSRPAGNKWEYAATVPLIPVHLRPRRGLPNYHVLFEAEWTQRYPVDPYLLRRIGGDAWVVLAAWELTEVERSVMSSRIRN